MNGCPSLTTELNAQTFRQYYYLKEELVDFCRKNGLQATGSKSELSERIAVFLESGKRTRTDHEARKSQSGGKAASGEIKPDNIIEENFVCSEKHRAFFKKHIGKGFSFNVAFQKWLKSNAGKTYADAIAAYHQILKEKKTNGKGEIEKQFEYNTYIRDFFAANKGKTLSQAIKCWKFKKSQKGHNRYEDSDLQALAAEKQ